MLPLVVLMLDIHIIKERICMNVSVRVFAKVSLAVAVVVLLGGCKPLFDLFKKDRAPEKIAPIKEERKLKGAVLLNIDGKSVVTEDDFNKHLAQMLQANPYFRGATADSLPKQLQRKFFDELIKQELIVAWANKNNIREDQEFKKNYKELKKLVQRSLFVQFYEKKIFDDIKITDEEVKDHYNKNKDKFVKEQGGILVEGVEFSSVNGVDAFLAKVLGKEAEFKKIAKVSYSKEFEDFGRVADKDLDGKLPKEIKNKVFALSKFPKVLKVAAGDKTWVVCALDKKDILYFGFDEIKDQLKEMIKVNKFKDLLNEKIDKLKNGFKININEDFFKDTVAPQKDIADVTEPVARTAATAAV